MYFATIVETIRRLPLVLLRNSFTAVDPKRTRLWKALRTGNVTERDLGHGVISHTLPEGICWVEIDSGVDRVLLLRDSRQEHGDLFSIAENLFLRGDPHREKVMVVEGAPGIGKSWWLNYVLKRCAEPAHNYTVVFECEATRSIFVFLNSADEVVEYSCISEVPEAASPSTWRLYDPSHVPKSVQRLPPGQAMTVIATLPFETVSRPFCKGCVPIYTMPPSSLEQLRAALPLFGHSEPDITNRFEHSGGSLRNILRPDYAKRMRRSALFTVEPRTAERILEIGMGGMCPEKEICHELFHTFLKPTASAAASAVVSAVASTASAASATAASAASATAASASAAAATPATDSAATSAAAPAAAAVEVALAAPAVAQPLIPIEDLKSMYSSEVSRFINDDVRFDFLVQNGNWKRSEWRSLMRLLTTGSAVDGAVEQVFHNFGPAWETAVYHTAGALGGIQKSLYTCARCDGGCKVP